MSKSVELVVAHYKEDLSWINMIKCQDVHVTIYHKLDRVEFARLGDDPPVPASFPGQSVTHKYLRNEGREAQTYLYHLAHEWDNIHPVTVFTQGKIWDHRLHPFDKTFIGGDPVEWINTGKWKDLRGFEPLTGWIATSDKDGGPWHPDMLPMDNAYKTFFGEDMPKTIEFHTGAIFAVDKQAIEHLGFLKVNRLLTYSRTNQCFPWVAERLWKEFFTKDVVC